jgi:peptidyl-prolyl cis-trans isomerase C
MPKKPNLPKNNRRAWDATRLALIGACAVAFVIAGCESSGKADATNPKTPLAEVNGKKITVADVEARLAQLPRLARAEFTGDQGRERMVQRMVEERMLLLAAESEGIERDDAVKAKLEDARREMLVQAYLDKKQNEASSVADQEIRAYYDAHPDEFRSEEGLRVRMILSSNKKRLQNIRNDIAHGRITLENAARQEGEFPEIQSAAGMIPEWVHKDRAVPWIGNHPQFHQAAFTLPPGEISPVIETPKGFLILRVEERREPEVRPLEEIRTDIEAKLVREKATAALPRLLDDLKKRYRVKIYEPAGKSAKELFAAAQAQSDPRERIRIYDEILERHPGDAHAAEALFMIGFIQAEELHDQAAAAETFQKVLKEYPTSELAESAKFMLSEKAQKLPEFEVDTTRANAPGDAS